MTKLAFLALSLSTLPLVACGGGGESDADFKAAVITDMHDSISVQLADLVQAAKDLQAAAPTGHGWDKTTDAAAITAMKEAWKRTRIAYEHVEGATAPIFPDLDFTMDARYDDYLSDPRVGSGGDSTPFDGTGVTGMHGIERILYSDQIPARVSTFEGTLPGNSTAHFPTNAAEAMQFKTGICQRLIDDANMLHDQWQPAAIDLGAAYQGLVGLMNEQKEKVDLASSGEEESRYSQLTLFDLRNNLAGTKTVYELFRPWIAARSDVNDQDAMIEAGFGHLDASYSASSGDAIPEVPDGWSSDDPSPAALATPFGMLWESVHVAVDPDTDGSVVFEMNEVAKILGFPEFVE